MRYVAILLLVTLAAFYLALNHTVAPIPVDPLPTVIAISISIPLPLADPNLVADRWWEDDLPTRR